MLNSTFESFNAFFDKTSSSASADEFKRNAERESKVFASSSARREAGITPDPFFLHDYSPRPAYHWIVPSSATVPSFLSTELVQAALVASKDALDTSLEKADSAVKSVLIGVYELDQAGYGRSAAQEVMLFVERNLKRNCLREANRILETADISRLSSRSLIGLIRSTSRLKEQLPAWQQAYLDSRKQVAKLGKNPNSLFVGLPTINDANGTQEAR